MAPQTFEPLVPLRLRPEEQWLLHHVLAERIEAVRRSRNGSVGPGVQALQAFNKLEEGSHLFTVDELRRVRSALVAFRRRPGLAESDAEAVGRIVDRIDDAFASYRDRVPP